MDRGSHVSDDTQQCTEIEETIEYDWDSDQKPITLKSCQLSTPFESKIGEFDNDFTSLEPVPLTYKQATTGANRKQWHSPTTDELQSLNKHNTWTIVPRPPPSVPIIPVKWIFGIKTDGRKKARLVVIGCRDPENYTAIDKASRTPSIDTTRWLFAHCSYNKMPLIQLDIVAAFIHVP